MLGKLLKYEIKATARVFIPLYGIVFLLAIINRIFSMLKTPFYLEENANFLSVSANVTITAYVLMIFAIFIFTLVIMIQRFYKSLLGDEGYLMFTLPVRPMEHVIAKLITSVMWIVASCLTTGLSLLIWFANKEFFYGLRYVWDEILELMTEMGPRLGAFTAEMIVLVVLSMFSTILAIYMAMSIGQQFNNHRILGSFGAYIGINVAGNFIGSLLSLVFMMPWVQKNFEYDPLKFLVNWIMPLGIVIDVACVAIFVLVINYLLTKKLNLE